MLPGLSANVKDLRPSETVAISAETKRRRALGETVFDLSVGEPDFDTPAMIADAGIAAIRQGQTRYPPNVGLAELRKGIAQTLSRLSGGRPVDADRIVVSSGSKQSIFNACFTLFGPGDEVLIPSPAWVSYPQIVHLCRAEPRLVPGRADHNLKAGVAELEAARTPRTRGLILCSPCNPTGAVYASAELRAILEWAQAHGLWVISDEIYRPIHYGDGPAAGVLDFEDALLERVVVVYGASKAYAMTGWRIGSAYAPAAVAKGMAALQSHTTTGANHPAQWAAVAAFTDGRVAGEVDRMVAAFRQRRDLVVARFRRDLPQVGFVEPEGAFYFFFRVDGLRDDGTVTGSSFCEAIMQHEGVALVPGAAFGDDRWVRMSYAVSDAELAAALDRIVRMAGVLAGAEVA